MPTPISIIKQQQKMRILGKIRTGIKTTGISKKGTEYTAPKSLETFRFTSQDKAILEAISAKYGGQVQTWENAWEVITEASQIFVRLWPVESRMQYEFYGKGGRLRVCDGATCSRVVQKGEEFSMEDVPCFCDGLPDKQKCDLKLRFVFELAGFGIPGLWNFETGSQYAAREMTPMYDRMLGEGGNGCLAVLGIEPKTEIELNETKHFNVPYLTAYPGMQTDYLALNPIDMRSVLAPPRIVSPALEAPNYSAAAVDHATGEVLEPEVVDPLADEPATDEPVSASYVVSEGDVAPFVAAYKLSPNAAKRLTEFKDVPLLDDLADLLDKMNGANLNVNNLIIQVGSYKNLVEKYERYGSGQ